MEKKFTHAVGSPLKVQGALSNLPPIFNTLCPPAIYTASKAGRAQPTCAGMLQTVFCLSC